MRLLFPSDPFNKSAPDESYAEEFEAWRQLGMQCSLFSLEEFDEGEFRATPAFASQEVVLYRGWMLTPGKYVELCKAITASGATPKVSPEEYRRCHYLPEWYSLCRDFTPETVIFPPQADFMVGLAGLEWPGYFVKDFVKSLTTQRGSVASSPEEVAEIVRLLERYRGEVEGGVCVRRFELLLAETEERYFVFNGQAYSRQGHVPGLVHELTRRIDSPFFSADIVSSEGGELRLIELGDGQVSDRKKWPVERFLAMLSTA